MKTNQKKPEKKLSMREKKQLANLKNNSQLHFQIGLIAVLFIVFGIFQLKFKTKEYHINKPIDEIADVSFVPHDYTIEKEKVIEPVEKKVKKQPKIITKIIAVEKLPDNTTETPVTKQPVSIPKVPSTTKKQKNVSQKIDKPIGVNFVTQIPMFTSCEKFKTRKKQMACISKKIANHIKRKFDGDVAVDNGITGIQKIFVMFTINKKGNIVNIKARSPHLVLEKEAIKAIRSLPKMKPGKKGNQTVAVSFSQPIIFEVE